jgi:hypothetical protein
VRKSSGLFPGLLGWLSLNCDLDNKAYWDQKDLVWKFDIVGGNSLFWISWSGVCELKDWEKYDFVWFHKYTVMEM